MYAHEAFKQFIEDYGFVGNEYNDDLFSHKVYQEKFESLGISNSNQFGFSFEGGLKKLGLSEDIIELIQHKIRMAQKTSFGQGYDFGMTQKTNEFRRLLGLEKMED